MCASAGNVALPDMAGELGIDHADIAWTITSYSLVFSSLLLLGGRAGQGLGAALLSPAALSIIASSFQGPERARVIAAWGAVGRGSSSRTVARSDRPRADTGSTQTRP